MILDRVVKFNDTIWYNTVQYGTVQYGTVPIKLYLRAVFHI